MPPIACVDLGTNTCLMLVASKNDDGSVRVLADRARIVRLGEGVDRTRMLADAAKERVLACLTDYAREARALGAQELHLVATSAMRDARNAPGFARTITERTGFEVRVIDGHEEAELTWAAVAADFPRGPLACFDVGGGSTETMVGHDGALHSRNSVDVGSVRLTERFLPHDPPTPAEVAACEAHVKAAFASSPDVPRDAPLVGVAGTLTTLMACARGDAVYDAPAMHGLRLRRDDVTRLKLRFASLASRERLQVTPLEPGRADVILAGAIIVEAVMLRHGRDDVIVGDRGVRYGLFARLAK